MRVCDCVCVCMRVCVCAFVYVCVYDLHICVVAQSMVLELRVLGQENPGSNPVLPCENLGMCIALGYSAVYMST